MSALRRANLDEYLTWLRAWLDAGHEPTHAYDYPWSRQTWLTATSDFTLGGECGANAVNIIVPAGVQHVRGDLGHNNLYFVDGPEQRGKFVPVFDNPEFQVLTGVPEFIRGEQRKHAEWERERAAAEKLRRRQAKESDVGRYAAPHNAPVRPAGSEETTT